LDIYRKNIHTFLFASKFMAKKTQEFWGDTFQWKILRNPFSAERHFDEWRAGEYALYFGRLVEEKGVDILLDAASRVPELPIIVVGDGPGRTLLEEEAVSRGGNNVRFVGPKWGDELDEILKDCRFVVVPSLWHENFPYVIFQAFAAGKPVVGTNRGGIPELVDHGLRGEIYEATSAEALAAAMMRMKRRDHNELRTMGEECHRFVKEEFNDESFYSALMEIYRGVVA